MGKVLFPRRRSGRRTLAARGFREGFTIFLGPAFEVDPS